MLSDTVRILDFDGSVAKQRELLARYKNNIVELKGIGPCARFFSSAATREAVGRLIPPSDKNSITFLGSGDFHHISEILISRFSEPLNLIVFDFHPDWDTHPPRFGCGSWVTEVLRRKNIVKVFLLGVSSFDIDSFSIHSGNIASLAGDRVEIYPYEHVPSRTFLKKVPDNVSINAERGFFFNKINWQELKTKNLNDFFRQMLTRISVRQVYVSVDKDCLNKESSLTNWEEGKMPLEKLLILLKLIKDNLDIVGMDIVGDHSPIRLKGAIKRVASHFDHPKSYSSFGAAEGTINSLNEATNLKILDLICS